MRLIRDNVVIDRCPSQRLDACSGRIPNVHHGVWLTKKTHEASPLVSVNKSG